MFSATNAKQSFGKMMDAAQQEPVMIIKQGRPFAVILSMQTYHAMQRKLAKLEKARKVKKA